MYDLIDRDAVISKIKSCITIPADNEWDSGYNTAMAEAKQYIQNAPAVNLCIPCNEMLPEKDKDVLLRQSNGDYVVGYLCSDDVFDTDCGFMGLDKITHWMPLPKSHESEE